MKTIGDYTKWSVKVLLALAVGLLAGCSSPAPVYSPVLVTPLTNGLATLQTVMSQMQQQVAVRAAIGADQRKTNGIVDLSWKNPDQTLVWILNRTLGTTYFAGVKTAITLGRQLVGTNEYVAFNQNEWTGYRYSNTLLTPVASDQTSVSIEMFMFKVKWPGAAGTLQASTNLIYWRDVGPMPAGGAVIVTNNGTKEFFRVKVL